MVYHFSSFPLEISMTLPNKRKSEGRMDQFLKLHKLFQKLISDSLGGDKAHFFFPLLFWTFALALKFFCSRFKEFFHLLLWNLHPYFPVGSLFAPAWCCITFAKSTPKLLFENWARTLPFFQNIQRKWICVIPLPVFQRMNLEDTFLPSIHFNPSISLSYFSSIHPLLSSFSAFFRWMAKTLMWNPFISFPLHFHSSCHHPFLSRSHPSLTFLPAIQSLDVQHSLRSKSISVLRFPRLTWFRSRYVSLSKLFFVICTTLCYPWLYNLILCSFFLFPSSWGGNKERKDFSSNLLRDFQHLHFWVWSINRSGTHSTNCFNTLLLFLSFGLQSKLHYFFSPFFLIIDSLYTSSTWNPFSLWLNLSSSSPSVSDVSFLRSNTLDIHCPENKPMEESND